MLLLDFRFAACSSGASFEPEVILLAIGWYLRFSLSYRDVEELLAERGLSVDHVTVWRWVQRYAPELERRLRRHLKPTNDSWRVDETYVRVKGKWVYLYRAVDSSGATIDFLLSAKRDAATAQRFLAKALGGENHPEPRVINSDKHAAYITRRRLCSSKTRVIWPTTANTAPCSISITSWNRITVRSNVGSTRASISVRSGVRGAPSAWRPYRSTVSLGGSSTAIMSPQLA
jgi:transposase-like protein